MTLEIVRKQRGIPFIKRGMMVYNHYNGKFGRITSANSSGNLNIKFDNENYSVNCHPLWEMTYYSSDGTIIKTFRDSVQQSLSGSQGSPKLPSATSDKLKRCTK